MRILLFFYVTVLLSGCGSYPKDYRAVGGETLQFPDSNCSVLLDEIKEKWAVHKTVHKEGECYYYNKKLVEKIIENKDCFIGLKMNDVYKLMGEPSKIYEPNYFYLMSKNCTNEYDYINDEYHHLRFTALDTIGAVDYYPIVTHY